MTSTAEAPRQEIAIIGAGIAGLSCATRLAAAGHDVHVFDKGRGPGGRMSTRRVALPGGDAAFDHGAQYFTARDARFAAQVEAWAAAGVVARWPAAGDDAWVGTPGMNAPVRALADAFAVRWSTRIDALVRVGAGAGGRAGWRLDGDGVDARVYDRVVAAIPPSQAAPGRTLGAAGSARLVAGAPGGRRRDSGRCTALGVRRAGRCGAAGAVAGDGTPLALCPQRQCRQTAACGRRTRGLAPAATGWRVRASSARGCPDPRSRRPCSRRQRELTCGVHPHGRAAA